MLKWRAKECYQGIIGILTDNDKEDCFWRSYSPELPLYQVSIETEGNMGDAYIPTSCANWYSASWTDFPYTEEYIEDYKK